MNVQSEIHSVISRATAKMMVGPKYESDSIEKLYDFMTGKCADILAEDFLNNKYNPVEYKNICNELARILLNIFEAYINKQYGT